MWHDDPERSVKATSFGEWFEDYLIGIFHGNFVYSEDYGGIVNNRQNYA